MSIIIADYDVARYNKLPNIRNAVKALTKSGASALVTGALKDAIVRHGVAERFAIAVLHAPFYLEGDGIDDPPEEPLAPGEQFVSFGAVVVPLNTSTLSPEDKAHIVPALWGFHEGAAPLTFAYAADPAADALSASDLAFFADVQGIIAAHPGAEHLGIALLAHTVPGVTALQGRTAVTLPGTVSALAPGDERYDVLWAVVDGAAAVRGAVSGGSLAGHFKGKLAECHDYKKADDVCNGWGTTHGINHGECNGYWPAGQSTCTGWRTPGGVPAGIPTGPPPGVPTWPLGGVPSWPFGGVPPWPFGAAPPGPQEGSSNTAQRGNAGDASVCWAWGPHAAY